MTGWASVELGLATLFRRESSTDKRHQCASQLIIDQSAHYHLAAINYKSAYYYAFNIKHNVRSNRVREHIDRKRRDRRR